MIILSNQLTACLEVELLNTIVSHIEWLRGRDLFFQCFVHVIAFAFLGFALALITYVYDIHSEFCIWTWKFKRSNDYFCILHVDFVNMSHFGRALHAQCDSLDFSFSFHSYK